MHAYEHTYVIYFLLIMLCKFVNKMYIKSHDMRKNLVSVRGGGADKIKPEDHWSCIGHLSAEGMLKSVVTEEKKFKHSTWTGVDNPLGPKF